MKALMMTMGWVLTMSAAYSQNYWVVETNSENRSVVKIYNSQDQLVTESKSERRIDINKRRERKRLNRMARQTRQLFWSKR